MRSSHRSTAFGATFSACASLGALSACSAIVGVEDFATGTDAATFNDSGRHDASEPTREDAHAHDAKSDSKPKGDASSSRDAGEKDAAHDTAADAPPLPCATRSVDDSIGVYVDVDAVSPIGCGDRASPCPSLSSGLGAAASTGKTTLFVGAGTYASTSAIALPDGVTLSGGWTSSWTGSCDPGDIPVLSVAADVALTIGSASTPSTGTVTLDTISVINASVASGGTGASFYGVLAVGSAGSSLILTNVSVTVPAGDSGVMGSAGATGASGPSGGCAATAVAPAPGDQGTAATGGTYGAGGYMPTGPDGSTASTGGTGTTQTATPPACTTAPESTICMPLPNHNLCESNIPEIVCSPATLAGCGGKGGAGGGSGGDGGSSIALYLWNETAQVSGGSLVAANGGPGGAGGTGGSGGAGGPGASPGSASYNTSCTLSGLFECVAATASITGKSASAGGDGASGGEGGGGAGGDSYAIYTNAPAALTLSPSPALHSKAAGMGGLPNGSNGHSGLTNN
jgi:collagen type VII alpha